MIEPLDRGPDTPSIRRLEAEDVDQVHEIETLCYRSPWSRDSFLWDLQDPRYSLSLVLARAAPGPTGGRRILGYVCTWIIGDEMQVNNLAVHPDDRGRGHGERLLRAALAEGIRRGVRFCYLDVRPSNAPARNLYFKLGFRDHGLRPRYYQDTSEDAIVMRLGLRTAP